MKRIKRFYDSVDIRRSTENSFSLLLNGKTVKTPLGEPFNLSNEAIAAAVATEWQLQKEFVVPNTMPINTILMTHIDIDSKLTRNDKLLQISRFFQTDTLRFPESDELSGLFKMQNEKWHPIFQHLKSSNITFTQCRGTFSLPESTEAEITAINNVLLKDYDPLLLCMLETASKYLKSGTTAVGLIDRAITPQEAFEAAYAEELHQRREWGLVEGDHDIQDAETMLWLHGVYILSYLVRMWFTSYDIIQYSENNFHGIHQNCMHIFFLVE